MNKKAIDAIPNYLKELKPTLAGKLLYRWLPFRKQIILQNMRTVFQNRLTEQELKLLAQAFYSHLATSIKENLLMRLWSEKKIKSKAKVLGTEYVAEALKQNKGMLVLTGHFGNWEFAPIAGILNFKMLQGRFYFVRRLLGTKWLEKLLFRRYYQAGLNVIPKKNALSKVCDALEDNSAVVFVLDQHASIEAKDGIKVDFFGKPAGTYRSLATIARNMVVPVIPAQTYRLENGVHVLEFLPPLELIEGESAKQTLYLNTQQYNHILEEMILRYPEQWMWLHKRWKL